MMLTSGALFWPIFTIEQIQMHQSMHTNTNQLLQMRRCEAVCAFLMDGSPYSMLSPDRCISLYSFIYILYHIPPNYIIIKYNRAQMNEQELQEVYEMVDNINFSRAKKNINRDFADGVMMAELIHHYNPKLISVHNYPPANSLSKKIENWNTLNLKVLKKIGISLSKQQIDDIVNAVPNVIEQVLYQILIRFQRPDEEGRLTQNARQIPKKVPSRNENTLQLEEGENKVARRYEFENQIIEGYENYQKRTKEEEEIVELAEKIEQAYSQLGKLNELNKVKEDVVRNLEKKLQKFILT